MADRIADIEALQQQYAESLERMGQGHRDAGQANAALQASADDAKQSRCGAKGGGGGLAAHGWQAQDSTWFPGDVLPLLFVR